MKVSFAVITKDRPMLLNDCLRSVFNQSVLPNEIIIVDSSSDTYSLKLVQELRPVHNIPITYYYERRSGFPIARNIVLALSKNPWVVFMDDDCIADSEWLRSIKQVIQKTPTAAVIAGKTLPYYKDNVVSQAAAFNEFFWKSIGRYKDTIVNYETIDNKNTALNLSFIQKHHVIYDESLHADNGSSEDCDLGKQIQAARGSAIYADSAIVYHKNKTSLYAYTKRLLARKKGYLSFQRKWRLKKAKTHLGALRSPSVFIQYCVEHDISLLQSLEIYSILLYTFALLRIDYVMHKIRGDV